MTDNNIQVFYSYSHKDKKLFKSLKDHLEPLVRERIITNWYDRKIIPGDSWNAKIRSNLEKSDIILFLLSGDFLASSYINEMEVKHAMELHYSGKAIVVPIMLRPCDLEFTPFKDIQGLPTDMIAITKWRLRDDAYMNIVHGLKKVINRIKDRRKIILNQESKWEALIEGYKQNTELIKMELQTKEKALQHIAMELHDDIGQQLSGIVLLLACIDNYADIETRDELRKKSIVYLRETQATIRYLSHSVVEDVLRNEFDLKKEILKLESVFTANPAFNLKTELSGIEQLSNPQLGINVFRILQELLNNIHKHAAATEAVILLKYTGKQVSITVSDNGTGFRKNDEPFNKGIGLKNIEYRVRIYNGTINIASEPGAGTSIHIIISHESYYKDPLRKSVEFLEHG